jgi:hypothetical protein
MRKTTRKLVLPRETIRILGDVELGHVDGGSVPAGIPPDSGADVCPTFAPVPAPPVEANIRR